MENDQHFMELALAQARLALEQGEVPVGAIVVMDHDLAGVRLNVPVVVGQAHNDRETNQNPVGHAELLAIQQAAEKLERWRLTGCTLYVTLEPCLMCSGAIVLARVDRVVYGTRDPKAGAVHSLYQTLGDVRLNHRPEVVSGIKEQECADLLRNFFKAKREVSKN